MKKIKLFLIILLIVPAIQSQSIIINELFNSSNISIADAGKDSIYKFNSFGDELQSFGGPEIFNQPYGVAFFNKTLYVADTGNNRILRFILSTEL